MRNRDGGRWFAAIGAALLAALAAGCNGSSGGGGGPAGPGGLESWSPFLVAGVSGQPEAVTWTYLVNGGEPLSVDQQGVSATITFPSPMTVRYDPLTHERTTEMPFRFSGTYPDVPGTVTGDGTATVVESISVSDGVTHVDRQTARAELDAAWLLVSVDAQADSALVYDTPLDWFPDRADLGDLPVGFVHAPADDVSGNLSGTAKASVTGFPAQEIPFDHDVSAPQRWEVVDRLASLEVGGKTWSDVVVVDLTTTLPDLTDPGAAATAPASVRMWFAKGIGLIKATGVLSLYESPIDVEIVSTSLE